MGKPLGVMIATKLAVRCGGADAPAGTGRRHLVGIGRGRHRLHRRVFITELALTDPVQRSNAKLGILAASVLAAGLSIATLARSRTPRESAGPDGG